MTVFNRLLEIHPEHAEIWCYKVLLLISMNQIDEAIEAFEIVISLEPQNGDLSLDKGHMPYIGYGRLEKAIEAFQRIKLFLTDSGLLYFKSCVFELLAKSEESIEALKSMIEFTPDAAQAWFDLGKNLESRGRCEEAIEAYETVIKYVPDFAEAWTRIGNIQHIFLGDVERAAEAYDMAIQCDNEDQGAWNQKGLLLFNQHDYEKAKEAHRKAIECYPEFADAWINLGNCHFCLHEYNLAKNAYHVAIEHYHLNPWALWIKIGKCNSYLGDYEKAIIAYDITLENNPKNSEAWLNKSDCYIKLSEFGKATKAYNMAVKYQDESAEYWCIKGSELSIKGEFKQALDAYKMSIRYDSDYLLAWYGAACMFEKINKKQMSLRFLQKTIELNKQKLEKSQLSYCGLTL